MRPPARWCPTHEEHGRKADGERHAFYDAHQRDPESRGFYNSAAWARARATKLAEHPVCERCRRTWATSVHHVRPLKKCSPAERLDQRNLMAVCGPCHNTIEAEAAKAER